MGNVIRGLFKEKLTNPFKCTAIIAAGGTGQRMGLSFNKLFLTIDEKPILAYTLDAFEESDIIEDIIIVCNEKDLPLCEDVVSDFEYSKIKSIVTGGDTRQESVYKGLKDVSEYTDVVIIHDGARPLVTSDIIEITAQTAFDDGAAAAGVIPTDTLKLVQNNKIKGTVDRNSHVLIQTPQAFAKDIIIKAHEYALKNNIIATDDCALVEVINNPITVVPGSHNNIKLTTPDDYLFISSCLNFRGDFE